MWALYGALQTAVQTACESKLRNDRLVILCAQAQSDPCGFLDAENR